MLKITSLQHPLVKHFVKLRKERSYRLKKQSVLIEGSTMIEELPSSCKIKNIISTKPYPSSILVTDEIMAKISSMQTSNKMIAEVELPQESSLIGKERILVLDGLSDPSNLGALLRSALAFHFDGVFLLNNCTDPYNDKALRSAKGATFRLPLQAGSWDELMRMHLPLFVADIQGEPCSLLKGQKKGMLLMGNEVHGPSAVPKELKPTFITIPMDSVIESLNVSVAGGILMYLFNE